LANFFVVKKDTKLFLGLIAQLNTIILANFFVVRTDTRLLLGK
jgi:hypothetical protein